MIVLQYLNLKIMFFQVFKMGLFDLIETGFDCADETINFGTRSIGYDSLYEISTIACLKSSAEGVRNQHFLLMFVIRFL